MFVIDCCSLTCPAPVIKCKEALNSKKAKKIQVLVDNKPALENVNRFLESFGYKVEISQDQESLWVLHGIMEIEESGLSTPENGNIEKKLNQVSESNLDLSQFEADKKTLILIATENLGRGDDELGKKLMESFLSCAHEMSPWQIIFVNGGVKLTAHEGNCLESIKKLEADGVRILVCGACLNHFNLYEKKMVGETTNMLDIATAMALADKVISL